MKHEKEIFSSLGDSSVVTIQGRSRVVGPALCNFDGFLMPRTIVVNGVLHKALRKLQIQRPDIVPQEMDVFNETSIHREASRRGAHTRAKEAGGVPELYMLMHNRWWTGVQKQGGILPNMPMSELYMEITPSLKSKITFPLAL